MPIAFAITIRNPEVVPPHREHRTVPGLAALPVRPVINRERALQACP